MRVVDLLWPPSAEFFERRVGDEEVATAGTDLETRLPGSVTIGAPGCHETEISGNACKLGADVRRVLRVVRLDTTESGVAKILEDGAQRGVTRIDRQGCAIEVTPPDSVVKVMASIAVRRSRPTYAGPPSPSRSRKA